MKIKVYKQLTEDAKNIRKKVFMEEQGFVNEFDEIDYSAIHIVLYDGTIPVATCRVFKGEEDNTYILGRLAVMKEYRGRSIGKKMLEEAEKVVAGNGGEFIKLHAQCRAKDFYAISGYMEYGNVEEDEGCPHIWMRKKIGKSANKILL